MATKDVTVRVSEGSYDLGKGIADFIGAVQAALSDGWQAGEDLPAIVTAAMVNLVPYIGALSSVKDEWTEDQAAFMRAWALAGAQVYEKIT